MEITNKIEREQDMNTNTINKVPFQGTDGKVHYLECDWCKQEAGHGMAPRRPILCGMHIKIKQETL
jgi:hypothetical protein